MDMYQCCPVLFLYLDMNPDITKYAYIHNLYPV